MVNNNAGLQLIKDLINEHKIDCDFVLQNNYVFTQLESYVQKIEDEVRTAQGLGLMLSTWILAPCPLR